MAKKHTALPALRRAAKFAGSQAKLAGIMDCNPSFVSLVLNPDRPEELSFRHCQRIEKALKGQVTKEQLRPDIYR